MKYRKAVVWTVALAVAALLVAGGATASEKAQKPEWFFHDIVDVAFVKQHITVPMSDNVMIIDARPKRAKYDKGHIPMAVSIPDTYFDKNVDKLPADKNALLIFYCGGLKCKLSHKSAAKAEALGYTNVKVFAKGFPQWMKENGNYAAVSVDWVQKQLEGDGNMVLVDSRPKRKKYDKGHIPGAVSIPDTFFDKEMGQLPEDKTLPVVFYCGGYKCKLSHKSAAKAIELGYTNVKVFAGGYPEWKQAYGATMAAAAEPATSIKAGKEEGSIDVGEFERMVKENPESLYVVDVRDPDEFANGSLKTAVNIPVDKLMDRVSELPADKPVVFICGTGARSGESYYMVQDMRPELKDVYYVEAEMTFAKDGSFEIVQPKS